MVPAVSADVLVNETWGVVLVPLLPTTVTVIVALVVLEDDGLNTDCRTALS